MSPRFHSSGRSPFQQPLAPHRRQHIHGAVRPMAAPRREISMTAILGLGVAIFCLLYFTAQLLRPYL